MATRPRQPRPGTAGLPKASLPGTLVKEEGSAHALEMLRTAVGRSRHLDGLSAHALEHLARIFAFVRFEAEEVVIRAREPATWCGMILEGDLEARDDSGTSLSVLGQGALIGEVALFFGGHRTASMVALTPGHLACISSRELHRCLATDPEIGVALMRSLARSALVSVGPKNVESARLAWMGSVSADGTLNTESGETEAGLLRAQLDNWVRSDFGANFELTPAQMREIADELQLYGYRSGERLLRRDGRMDFVLVVLSGSIGYAVGGHVVHTVGRGSMLNARLFVDDHAGSRYDLVGVDGGYVGGLSFGSVEALCARSAELGLSLTKALGCAAVEAVLMEVGTEARVSRPRAKASGMESYLRKKLEAAQAANERRRSLRAGGGGGGDGASSAHVASADELAAERHRTRTAAILAQKYERENAALQDSNHHLLGRVAELEAALRSRGLLKADGSLVSSSVSDEARISSVEAERDSLRHKLDEQAVELDALRARQAEMQAEIDDLEAEVQELSGDGGAEGGGPAAGSEHGWGGAGSPPGSEPGTPSRAASARGRRGSFLPSGSPAARRTAARHNRRRSTRNSVAAATAVGPPLSPDGGRRAGGGGGGGGGSLALTAATERAKTLELHVERLTTELAGAQLAFQDRGRQLLDTVTEAEAMRVDLLRERDARSATQARLHQSLNRLSEVQKHSQLVQHRNVELMQSSGVQVLVVMRALVDVDAERDSLEKELRRQAAAAKEHGLAYRLRVRLLLRRAERAEADAAEAREGLAALQAAARHDWRTELAGARAEAAEARAALQGSLARQRGLSASLAAAEAREREAQDAAVEAALEAEDLGKALGARDARLRALHAQLGASRREIDRIRRRVSLSHDHATTEPLFFALDTMEARVRELESGFGPLLAAGPLGDGGSALTGSDGSRWASPQGSALSGAHAGARPSRRSRSPPPPSGAHGSLSGALASPREHGSSWAAVRPATAPARKHLPMSASLGATSAVKGALPARHLGGAPSGDRASPPRARAGRFAGASMAAAQPGGVRPRTAPMRAHRGLPPPADAHAGQLAADGQQAAMLEQPSKQPPAGSGGGAQLRVVSRAPTLLGAASGSQSQAADVHVAPAQERRPPLGAAVYPPFTGQLAARGASVVTDRRSTG